MEISEQQSKCGKGGGGQSSNLYVIGLYVKEEGAMNRTLYVRRGGQTNRDQRF